MGYCCVPECKGRIGHHFPQDPELRAKWLVAVRRKVLAFTPHTIVCHDHFTPQDYCTDVNFQGRLFYCHIYCFNLSSGNVL